MFAFFGSKIGLMLLAVTVIAVSLAVVSRNWSCQSPKPPHIKTFGPFTVDQATSGTSIALKGRRVAHLENVAAPAEGERYFEESRQSLNSISGNTITIDVPKDHRLERVSHYDGEVYGETGQCLQLSQLTAGWVWCLPKAPKAYRTAEDVARKKKLGIWKESIGRMEFSPDGTCRPMYPEDGPKEMTPEEFEQRKAEIAFVIWMDCHRPNCPQCKQAKSGEDACDVAKAKWAELEKRYKPAEAVK